MAQWHKEEQWHSETELISGTVIVEQLNSGTVEQSGKVVQ